MRSLPAGFNLIGYATSPTGLGEDLRSFAALLNTLEIPFSITDIPTDSSGKIKPQFKHLSVDDFANSVFFMSPMECLNLSQHHPQLFSEPTLKIGYFLWELPDFPDEYLPALDLVDQIWCPSKFVQQAFFEKSPKLVLAIPLPVIEHQANQQNFRQELKISKDAFVCLFMFDLHSTLNRKNPQGVIEAFLQFAQGKDDVFLVLKINRWENVARSQLRWLPKHPQIKLLTQTLETPALASLYQSANAYLSLHRSEGFGRTLVEALQHGLSVIATNYSGPADFLNEENAKILGWLPQSVLKDDYPFNQLSIWANPMIEDAVAALEDLYQASPYHRSNSAIEAGQAFSVQNLANKYEPILRSYLR